VIQQQHQFGCVESTSCFGQQLILGEIRAAFDRRR
jgi:hypothetical protein